MSNQFHSASTVHTAIRWLARISSLLLIGLVIAIFFGAGGFPKIAGEQNSVKIEFLALGVMLIGLVVGWWQELAGGLVTLAGLVGLNVVELLVNGRLAQGAFPAFVIPGVLFLLSGLMTIRMQKNLSKTF
ncbi:hypothetical protein KIH39_11625 [Telmatocola sphagniphila]|uniref:DUF7670 domain-containing protein n=1 Tax=Telmatocola sphagniphila TaxID=1123043 RepID=A0A8E6F082_9BACT|nr:hypothetical protein [Telmatocola sphagniphila]QVL34523.1 hypothetical protein KIH39_11625 [Telmatocola sphagniphila]